MDIKLCNVPRGGLDLKLSGGDLVTDPGFSTFVLACLWTDRRADDDDGLPIEEDPRGYWADREGDRWGSRLWLLDRAKAVSATLSQGEAFCAEGLEVMKKLGMAASVTTKAAFGRPGLMKIDIKIQRDARPRWDDVWKGTERDVAIDGPGQALRVLFA